MLVGRLIINVAVTVDGAFEAPTPAPNGWLVLDSDSQQASLEMWQAADAMLIGRKTYEGLSAVWPQLAAVPGYEAYAHRMNSMPKYVASRTLRGPLTGREMRIEIHERIDLLEEERVPEIESFLLSIQGLVESVLGRKLEGVKVEVAGRPAHAGLYRRYFSGPVTFGADVSALVIPASWLDHPCPFADADLHRVSVLKLEAMAERLKGRRYTAALVEELMASGGQGGRSLDEVARRLAVSTRTLIRRLREAGTTYRDLRDGHRRTLATELLSDTSLTAAEVAYRLGFEDAVQRHPVFRDTATSSLTRGSPGGHEVRRGHAGSSVRSSSSRSR